MQKIFFRSAASAFILIASACLASAQEYIQLPAAIHVASDISDGKLSLEDIAAAAQKCGFPVLIPTDRDSLAWEYGIGPFRNIFKKTVSQRSVLSYGADKYLKRIEMLKKEFPGMIIIPGIESAPYYYWQGSIFSNDLTIKDWHKHMLVIGLFSAEDLEHLPVLGNPNARFNKKIDQYHGNLGVAPYQQLINYANSHNALTFWAHPESSNIDRSGSVNIETDEHSGYLLRTKDYTGFSVFYEGFKRVGVIGGIWDRILREYCADQRKFPVWAIAGLAFDKTGSITSIMNDVRTVLLSRGSTAPLALDALKNGRLYCLRGKGSSSFVLDRFTVTDAEGNDKTMGEKAFIGDDPVIKIEGHILNGQSGPFKIQLIKDGGLLRVFETDAPFNVSFADSSGLESSRSYYRVQITSKDLVVITNPIFVQRQ
jgi:hypothetical protein